MGKSSESPASHSQHPGDPRPPGNMAFHGSKRVAGFPVQRRAGHHFSFLSFLKARRMPPWLGMWHRDQFLGEGAPLAPQPLEVAEGL